MSNTKPKVAVLLLEQFIERISIKKQNFDILPNLGLHIIIDVIKRKYNINIEHTQINNINNYDIILINVISYREVFNIIYTFEKYNIKEIRPKIIIGGFGVQNIKTYYKYGDYFVFGRGEETIIDIFEEILNNKKINHNYVFIKERNNFQEKFKIRQSNNLYPYKINKLKETMIGCPYRCYFCQYTMLRKYVNINNKYKDGEIYGGVESTWHDLDVKTGSRYTTSIDGISEKIRRIINKRIYDKDIINKLLSINKLKHVFLKIYLIGGYPNYEKEEDFKQFFNLFINLKDKLKPNRFIIRFQFNTLIPDILSPVQYLPLSTIDYRDFFKRMFNLSNILAINILKEKKIYFYIYSGIRSVYGNIQQILISRGCENDNILIKNLIFNTKFNRLSAKQKAKYLIDNKLVENHIRQYEIGDRGEWGYLQTYVSDKYLDNCSKKVHEGFKL